MTDLPRLEANLATLANGLVGVGAIAYILAGNKLWAILLIMAGVGFDGLDGMLSRRSLAPASAFGRVADSVSDAITFGLAPAMLLAVHTDHPEVWASRSPWTWLVGGVFAALAVARLIYFTWRGFHHSNFLGAPTPQSALAVGLLVLFGDVPGFLGPQPPLVLVGALAAALLMVTPIPFPKIRRSSVLRKAMTVTGVAFVLTIVPLQFRPAPGTPFYLFALGAAVVTAAGLLAYYVLGPRSVKLAESAGGGSPAIH